VRLVISAATRDKIRTFYFGKVVSDCSAAVKELRFAKMVGFCTGSVRILTPEGISKEGRRKGGHEPERRPWRVPTDRNISHFFVRNLHAGQIGSLSPLTRLLYH
jgi:hypothetical protein